MTWRFGVQCGPGCSGQVVCELISKQSIGYLTTDVCDEYESAPFAAGGIITPALFDILLAQSFYAPHVRREHVVCAVRLHA